MIQPAVLEQLKEPAMSLPRLSSEELMALTLMAPEKVAKYGELEDLKFLAHLHEVPEQVLDGFLAVLRICVREPFRDRVEAPCRELREWEAQLRALVFWYATGSGIIPNSIKASKVWQETRSFLFGNVGSDLQWELKPVIYRMFDYLNYLHFHHLQARNEQ